MEWSVDGYEDLLKERIDLLRKKFSGRLTPRESDRLSEINAVVDWVEDNKLNAALDRTFGVEMEE